MRVLHGADCGGLSSSQEKASALGTVLRVWLTLSVQSFGGGVATLALIRRAAVDKQGWVSEEEFGRFWGLVQLAPGINLVALTVLIGRRAAGGWGIAAAVAGLLLPSVALTVLMTAAYARVQHLLWVQAALRGIVPAVVGLGLVTAWQIAGPLLTASRRRGSASLALSLLVLGGGIFAAERHLPVLLILGGGALLMAAASWGRAR